MVRTRKATGSLPPPKRAYPTHSDNESDNESEVVPMRKRIKKEVTNDDDGIVEADDTHPPGKTTRISTLITGPESKARITGVNARTRRAKVRKSDLGKLARIMDLPIDAFCEIATHLTILDLLYLSRSSRPLRDLLMSKSSKVIWAAAIVGMGLPPCPSDMTEPQYANLFFEKFCHACSYPRVEKVDIHIRVRLCKGCTQLNTKRGLSIAKEQFGEDVAKMYEIYTLVPWRNMSLYNVKHEMNAGISSRHYLQSDFIEIVTKYLSFLPGSEEQKNFVSERQRTVIEIVEHSRIFDKWQGGQNWQKVNETNDVKKERREAILEKLRSLGYSDEDFSSLKDRYIQGETTKWYDHLGQPRKLTEQTWKKVRPRLEEIIALRREYRRREERDKQLWERKEELNLFFKSFEKDWSEGDGILILSFIEMVDSPEIKELLEEDECSIPITEDRWEIIKSRLPQCIQSHRKQVEEDAVRTLADARDRMNEISAVSRLTPTDNPGDTTNDATIATQILNHANAFFSAPGSKFRATPFADALREWHSEISQPYVNVRTKRIPRLQCNPFVLKMADSLLSSLGLEKNTTMQEMVDPDRSYVCLRCDPVFQKSLTWPLLIEHFMEELEWYESASASYQAKDIPLICDHDIDAESKLAIMQHESPHHDNNLPTAKSKNYKCHLCNKLHLYTQFDETIEFRSIKELAVHMERKHGITE